MLLAGQQGEHPQVVHAGAMPRQQRRVLALRHDGLEGPRGALDGRHPRLAHQAPLALVPLAQGREVGGEAAGRGRIGHAGEHGLAEGQVVRLRAVGQAQVKPAFLLLCRGVREVQVEHDLRAQAMHGRTNVCGLDRQAATFGNQEARVMDRA